MLSLISIIRIRAYGLQQAMTSSTEPVMGFIRGKVIVSWRPCALQYQGCVHCKYRYGLAFLWALWYLMSRGAAAFNILCSLWCQKVWLVVVGMRALFSQALVVQSFLSTSTGGCMFTSNTNTRRLLFFWRLLLVFYIQRCVQYECL